MTFTNELSFDNMPPPKREKLQWYWSPVFCGSWFLIFYVAVIPSFHSFPKVNSIRNEQHHPEEFIGERAEVQLLELSNIGVKLTGTPANEVEAVEFLKREIDIIKSNARLDLYDIEVDVQSASGEFMLWNMPTMYHNVQNVIVKLAPKGSTSTSYLLINSHFDSEVGSPGAGDDGVMVVVMLETLRVISISESPLKNPVVFLFNGAEENNLQGSHGFITQHKWAPNVKAMINLDSAGSGGREVLFQSGPNHPWLMKYYGESVPHPYASTPAEELFQNNFIPSDTDFRIFRDHGHVPGLDLAHTNNGFVYHTKYDRFSVLPRETYQTTGDNILALTRALANAPELEDPEKYSKGNAVFFDYLGWFTVHYTEGVGVAINITVSVCALISIAASMWFMLKKESYDGKMITMRLLQLLVCQILAVAVAIGLTILVAVIVNALNLQLSWYRASWIVFGLYFCPIFFALGIIPAFFLGWTKRKTEINLRHSVQMILHSHALILVFVTLLLTGFAIRSAFLPMISVLFYTCSVLLSLLMAFLFKSKTLWVPLHMVCQLLPFWFYTYLIYCFYKVFIAMQGRDGPNSNPEMLVSIVTAIFSIFFAGFLIPILYLFRKSKIFFSLFAVLTVVFVIIATTPAAFPFESKVAPKRFYVIHTNRVFNGYDGLVLRNESGFYVQPVDPRNVDVDDSVYKEAYGLSYTSENCDTEMYCGLPLYSTRWKDWVKYSRWIPSVKPNLPETTDLKLLSKSFLTETKVRYTFTLTGADRITMYIEPLKGAKVEDWSFNRTPLDENLDPPYFIYSTYSMDKRPLVFWVDLERHNEMWEGPTLKLAVGGQLLYHQDYYTKEYREYLESFPEWAYPTAWVASHESWLF